MITLSNTAFQRVSFASRPQSGPEKFFRDNQSLNRCYLYGNNDWLQYAGDGFHEPSHGWKFHIYADKSDWEKVANVVLPYLINQNVTHKTARTSQFIAQQDASRHQQGKLFSVEPASVEKMNTVMKEIDQLLANAHLTRNGRGIDGDIALPDGKSGRIFYRYALDEHGNYRDNRFDTLAYKPASIVDPFLEIKFNQFLKSLKPGHSFTIGREQNNDFCIPDDRISSRHCKITRAHNVGVVYIVQDLGSSNGTFINGRRIQQNAIEQADQLEIGQQKWTVQ